MRNSSPIKDDWITRHPDLTFWAFIVLVIIGTAGFGALIFR